MTRPTLFRIARLALFGLGCASLGAWWRSAPAPASSPTAPAADARPAQAPRLSAEDRLELRRAVADDVREAVAAALPARAAATRAEPAAAPDGVVAEASPPPSPARAAAHQAAHHAVEAAIGRGVWGPDDAQALRAAIPELGPDEATQVLAELSRAINGGQLQVAIHDRPIL